MRIPTLPQPPRGLVCTVGTPIEQLLIYLNDEWDGDKWGAPTRFVDNVPTGDDLNVYDAKACPGRCIIMDQDVGHTVVAPMAAAGKRQDHQAGHETPCWQEEIALAP
jgi:hypothetical protein